MNEWTENGENATIILFRRNIEMSKGIFERNRTLSEWKHEKRLLNVNENENADI